MGKINYAETLCEAVDTIVKERLTDVKYDTTIICTIIDDSRREEGIYKVSDGSASFEAYSSATNYRVNNNVYVQIPRGDMSEQKLIVAKKMDSTLQKSYTYNSPFSTLVDITGNLISAAIEPDATGLVANNPEEEELVLWTYNDNNTNSFMSEKGIDLTGYTRLGLKASFQSLIDQFEVKTSEDLMRTVKTIAGNYGLRLILTHEVEISSSQATQQGNVTKDEVMYLDVSDMNGNPYNFETFFEQEIVFDVAKLGIIKKISLVFYQKAGSFIDNNGNLFPHLDSFGNGVLPNLKISDIYLCLGYDSSEFADEMVRIFTFDQPTYNGSLQPRSENHKQLHARWIHKQSDGNFISVNEKHDLDYELYWYRYELGHASADEYSGVYWKLLSSQKKMNMAIGYMKFLILIGMNTIGLMIKILCGFPHLIPLGLCQM